jgi:hypothetical protein
MNALSYADKKRALGQMGIAVKTQGKYIVLEIGNISHTMPRVLFNALSVIDLKIEFIQGRQERADAINALSNQASAPATEKSASLTNRQRAVMEHVENNNGILPKDLERSFSNRVLFALRDKELLTLMCSALIKLLVPVTKEAALKALELHGVEEGMFVTHEVKELICDDAILLNDADIETAATELRNKKDALLAKGFNVQIARNEVVVTKRFSGKNLSHSIPRELFNDMCVREVVVAFIEATEDARVQLKVDRLNRYVAFENAILVKDIECKTTAVSVIKPTLPAKLTTAIKPLALTVVLYHTIMTALWFARLKGLCKKLMRYGLVHLVSPHSTSDVIECTDFVVTHDVSGLVVDNAVTEPNQSPDVKEPAKLVECTALVVYDKPQLNLALFSLVMFMLTMFNKVKQVVNNVIECVDFKVIKSLDNSAVIKNLENEIKEINDLIVNKQQVANYLSGNKRGAWGRRTKADTKRAIEINNLQIKLSFVKYRLETLNKGQLKLDNVLSTETLLLDAPAKEPLEVIAYHGTTKDFAQFSNDTDACNGIGTGLGHFFTDEIDYAKCYGDILITAKVTLKNPLIIEDYYGFDRISDVVHDSCTMRLFGKSYNEMFGDCEYDDNEQYKQLRVELNCDVVDKDYFKNSNAGRQRELKLLGYDGVILVGDKQSSRYTKVYCVFDNSQIEVIGKEWLGKQSTEPEDVVSEPTETDNIINDKNDANLSPVAPKKTRKPRVKKPVSPLVAEARQAAREFKKMEKLIAKAKEHLAFIEKANAALNAIVQKEKEHDTKPVQTHEATEEILNNSENVMNEKQATNKRKFLVLARIASEVGLPILKAHCVQQGLCRQVKPTQHYPKAFRFNGFN